MDSSDSDSSPSDTSYTPPQADKPIYRFENQSRSFIVINEGQSKDSRIRILGGRSCLQIATDKTEVYVYKIRWISLTEYELDGLIAKHTLDKDPRKFQIISPSATHVATRSGEECQV